MLNIVLFGPPGAGKGTQSEMLIEKYNLIHLSTGDILRKELANETDLGIEAKKYNTPDWMQCSIKYNNVIHSWEGSDKCKILIKSR